MRTALIAGLAGLAAACSQATDATPTSNTHIASTLDEDTKIAAVLIRADWCASCKVIEPKVEALRARGDIDGVQHITLDYTTRDDAAFFAAADAAGVGEAMRREFADEIITGEVILVDVNEHLAVADLRKSMSEDRMEEIIRIKLGEA